MTTWSGVAQAYRESFATLCAGMVPHMLADLPAGRLLDVGCGPGTLLVTALTEGRDAVGVDADPDMAALAAERAPGRVTCAALPHLPHETGEFDAVAANFVLNHVPDPRAAASELARVLRPDGRLAATIWPAGGSSWGAFVGDVFAAAGAAPLPGRALPPELDFHRTVDGLARLLTDADLAEVTTYEQEWTWAVRPEALWRGISGGVATAGETYRAQAPQIQAEIARVFRARAAREAAHGMLRFPVRAAYAVAAR